MQNITNEVNAPRKTLKFYLHHLAQLDKLLKVIQLLKKENKQLRQLLLTNSMEILPSGSEAQFKPKITCWHLE